MPVFGQPLARVSSRCFCSTPATAWLSPPPKKGTATSGICRGGVSSSTLLTFDCAVLLYAVVFFLRGGSCSLQTFFLSFLAWRGFGNSNWYIFAILCLYAVTWLVLRRRSMDRGAALSITTLSLGLMLFLLCAGKDQWWYDTLLCYPLGIWYYLYKDVIDRFMARNICYYPILALTLLTYGLVHKAWKLHLAFYILAMLLFALCVVFLTMKFDIRNPFLRYCGRHLTGLYLLQRIPMILLQPWFSTRSGLLAHSMYFLLSFALTFALDAVFCRWTKAMGIGVKQALQ